MEILKETTDWKCGFPVANHTYLFDGNKVIAYKNAMTGAIVKLKTPIRLDKRYRTFVRVADAALQRLGKSAPKLGKRSFLIKSSDKEYIVEVDEVTQKYTCSCPGFTFRGKCKHGVSVVEKLQS